MPSIRQNKASRLIQKELSLIFQKEARTLFHGIMVSVTVFRISPDLKEGKAYVSFFPVKNQDENLKHLNAIKGDIRRRLGMVLKNQVRNIPDLHFYLDDSIDYADEINVLLNNDNKE